MGPVDMLAFLPILSMIGIGLFRGILEASVAGMLAAVFVFWLGNSRLPAEVTMASLYSALDITLIIFGALLLLEAMKKSGRLGRIEQSLSNLRMSRNEKFLLLSLGLTGFFEGIAGFGTPGAIVAPLLIHLGYSPILSISSVLLFDTIFASFGAAGTPIRSMAEITGISPSFLAPATAVLNLSSGAVFLFMISRKWTGSERKRAWGMYAVMSSVLLMMSALSFEAAAFLAGMSVFAHVFFSERIAGMGKLLKAWAPYLFVSIFLLAQKLLPGISGFLRNPFLSFLAASAMVSGPGIIPEFRAVAGKTVKPFLILLFSIAAAKTMMAGDSPMTMTIAGALGQWLNLLSPLIGILGAFVSGSNTVSNIMFSGIFRDHAFLPFLNAGGSMGNAICFFNILSASASSKFRHPHRILRENLRYVAYSAALLVVLSLLLNQLINLLS